MIDDKTNCLITCGWTGLASKANSDEHKKRELEVHEDLNSRRAKARVYDEQMAHKGCGTGDYGSCVRDRNETEVKLSGWEICRRFLASLAVGMGNEISARECAKGRRPVRYRSGLRAPDSCATRNQESRGSDCFSFKLHKAGDVSRYGRT